MSRRMASGIRRKLQTATINVNTYKGRSRMHILDTLDYETILNM